MSDRRTSRAGEGPQVKRSPGRPRLPVQRMVEAALRIIDEDGADALSMRALAERLDSGTATFYRHFGSRAGLIGHVVDAVYAETALDAESLHALAWPEACRHIARTMFEVLRRHPNVVPLLVEQFPVGPHALAVRERCIAVLLANGFSPALAGRTYATLSRFVLGFGVQLQAAGTADGAGAVASGVLDDLDPERFPATRAVAGQLPVALTDEFEFGLSLLVGGLGQLVDSEPSAASTIAEDQLVVMTDAWLDADR